MMTVGGSLEEIAGRREGVKGENYGEIPSTTIDSQRGKVPESWLGVFDNPHGGYHVHLTLNKRETPIIGGAINPEALAPPSAHLATIGPP